MDAEARQRELIRALRAPGCYPHPVERVEHRETHVSHVLLAGAHAYKIKKPVDLGFLDFSTLADREHYCREELRLNGRLAPRLYLEVVPITGSPDQPLLEGAGAAIEYAVKMARFDEAGLLDRMVAEDRIERATITRLARRIAAFHEAADDRPPESDFGTAAAVLAPARANFRRIRAAVDAGTAARLDALADWTERRHAALGDAWRRRREAGRVRECHGDMHLGNIALVDGAPTIFDGIEFNAAMRWIDVASDIAFLVMDLDHRGVPALAGVLLDEWLAATGDYDALAVLRFYLVYRALVRAKIAAIRLEQLDDTAAAAEQRDRLAAYLSLAERYAAAWAPAVAVMRGVAGTGKSTAARVLVERIGAVRLRADVERRRLYPDPEPAVRYAPAAHDAVYARLRTLAERVTAAGFPAIVDATCLEVGRRAPLVELAAERGLPLRVIDMELPEALAGQRIEARARSRDDVSEAGTAVMREQRQRLEPLTGTETAVRIPVDNAGPAPRVPPMGLAHARGAGDDGVDE